MKTFFFIIFASTQILASSAFAREQSVLARVTVYWASGGGGSDAYTRAHKCSTGARLRVGHCAVDPKKIAYGSRVVFPDATCVAVDTGRDVVNRKAARRCGRTSAERSALVVDRFFETKGQAMRWANSHPQFITVRVLSPNEHMIESKNAGVIAKQSGTPNARGNSQNIRKQNPTGIAKTIAANDPVNPPQNKLVAANTSRAGDFLSRRF